MASVRPKIPGLTVCPVDEEEGEGIEIPTLNGSITIPESHRYGNCRSRNDFETLGVIRSGAFQIVYRCRDRNSNEIRALKKFKTSFENGFPLSSLRETSLLKTLKHVNIIAMYGVAAGDELQSNYLILDSWTCSLNDLIERGIPTVFEKSVVKSIMRQLFCGIDYIHDSLIVHRDINCNNILFTDDGILKIGGFSSSRFFTRGDMTPGVTELRYRAPELLLEGKRYTSAVDIWSSGCVLARLTLKDFLFKGSKIPKVLQSIAKVLGSPSENIWPGFNNLLSQRKETVIFEEEIQYSNMRNIFADHSFSLTQLLQNMLLYYPFARPSAKHCLHAPYFKEEPQPCSPETISSMLPEMEDAISL